MSDCPLCGDDENCPGEHELVEMAHVRSVCDDAYALISRAIADIHAAELDRRRAAVNVPMLLECARGRLKDNRLTTPEKKR